MPWTSLQVVHPQPQIKQAPSCQWTGSWFWRLHKLLWVCRIARHRILIEYRHTELNQTIEEVPRSSPHKMILLPAIIISDNKSPESTACPLTTCFICCRGWTTCKLVYGIYYLLGSFDLLMDAHNIFDSWCMPHDYMHPKLATSMLEWALIHGSDIKKSVTTTSNM